MEINKRQIDLRLIKFYLLIAAIFFVLRLLNHASAYPDTVGVRAINDLWRIGYVFALNYLLFEYVVPFIRKKRETIIYNFVIAFGCLIVFVMLYSWGLYAWRAFGVALHIYTSLVTKFDPEHIATEQMAYSMMSVFIFGIGRHIYSHIRLKQAAQQLRIEKQQAELGYLKSQTNPHFLFNTLNNIYSLSRDKNDKAPESILRLSKILRFMLYEAGGDYIPVEQELKIISDYIELEKLRYDDSLRINFNHDIENMKQALPPLLLMPLVENGFKHGVSETRSHPFIDIHLAIRNRYLVFVVKNSSEGSVTGETVKENIGLSNLRRQLQLLYTDYSLSVRKEPGVFIALLKINLASHV